MEEVRPPLVVGLMPKARQRARRLALAQGDKLAALRHDGSFQGIAPPPPPGYVSTMSPNRCSTTGRSPPTSAAWTLGARRPNVAGAASRLKPDKDGVAALGSLHLPIMESPASVDGCTAS